jgi:hypothetical protein
LIGDKQCRIGKDGGEKIGRLLSFLNIGTKEEEDEEEEEEEEE